LYPALTMAPGVDTPGYMISPRSGLGLFASDALVPGVDTPGNVISPRSGLEFFGTDALGPGVETPGCMMSPHSGLAEFGAGGVGRLRPTARLERFPCAAFGIWTDRADWPWATWSGTLGRRVRQAGGWLGSVWPDSKKTNSRFFWQLDRGLCRACMAGKSEARNPKFEGVEEVEAAVGRRSWRIFNSY
jgi:hypothetical protein